MRCIGEVEYECGVKCGCMSCVTFGVTCGLCDLFSM